MSKLVIKKGMTTEQRLRAIKKAADRFHKKIGKSQKIKRTETSWLDKKYDGDNINAWTDAPKYLNEHYGDRVREQNAYEREWD